MADIFIAINERRKTPKTVAPSRQINAPGHWGPLCIYRIPENLLASGDTKGNAYAPYFFSLALYQTREGLHQKQEHKRRALDQILQRTGHNVDLYRGSMRQLLEKASACYEGFLHLHKHPGSTSDNDVEPFVEMMMLDGCFILEILQGFSEGFVKLGYEEYDPVFSERGKYPFIRRDMILLENQIPLFVLGKLLELQSGMPDQDRQVAKLAINFFEPLMSSDPQKSSTSSFDDDDQVVGGLHLLDVLRCSILRGVDSQPADSSISRQKQVHCVTVLRNAGVRFKKGNDGDKLWDVRFKDGILTIPKLFIHDITKSLLFNLIAFEQCHLQCSNHIVSYAMLMDNLINSAQDVRYLCHKGIIEHWLGSDEEVADLFNGLCKKIVFYYRDSYLAPLSKALNEHYHDRPSTWVALFKLQYLKNPWTITSVIAASFLLLLTMAQTFYTVYAYYKPPS